MRIFSLFSKKSSSSHPSSPGLKSYLFSLLGEKPGNMQHYEIAVTHQSFADKNQLHYNYERLEFLGDAVLDMAISEHLYHLYPQKNEGELTKLRSAIVNRKSLNRLAKKIDLLAHIKTQVDLRTPGLSLPGNVLEALIGAIYVDKGYHTAKQFIIIKLLKAHVNLESLEMEYENYKSTLLEWAQKEGKGVEIDVKPSPTTKNFEAVVKIDGQESGNGRGRSKKNAEIEASLAALKKMGLKP